MNKTLNDFKTADGVRAGDLEPLKRMWWYRPGHTELTNGELGRLRIANGQLYCTNCGYIDECYASEAAALRAMAVALRTIADNAEREATRLEAGEKGVALGQEG